MMSACGDGTWNNPYPSESDVTDVIYSSFSERPKRLDPVSSYSGNEYQFIAQIYEPPLQYHYLLRPYTLIPLAAEAMPQVRYLNASEQEVSEDEISNIAFSEYVMAS